MINENFIYIGDGNLETSKYSNYTTNILTENHIKNLDLYGFTIINNILDDNSVIDYIDEIWSTIENSDLVKPPQRNMGEFSNKDDINMYKKKWNIPGKEMCMLNFAPIFHLKSTWKIRQDPELYEIFSKLYNNSKLWCTLDRVNIKPPDMGKTGNLHWDWNIYSDKNPGFQSIYNLTDRYFACIPGSNKKQWLSEFKNVYSHDIFNEHVDENTCFLSLNKKLDKTLWDLHKKIKIIHCPKNSLLIFTSRLLHAVSKNTTNKIQIASYVGYIPAKIRMKMAVNDMVINWTGWDHFNPYVKYNDDELQDRIRSYKSGNAPYCLPGGHRFNYIPRRAIPYYCKLWKKDKIKKHKRTNNNWIIENISINYKPPEITELGEKLLGIKKW